MKVQLNLAPDSPGRFEQVSSFNWSGPPHQHEELELNLVLSGQADILLTGRNYHLRTGALAWLFPEQPHLLINTSEDFRMWLGVFSRPFVQKHGKASGQTALAEDNPEGEHCRLLDADACRELDQLFASVESTGSDAYSFEQGLSWSLLRAWQRFQESDDIPVNLALHPAVERAALTLRREPQREDLAELAREVGLSPSWLSRRFKEQLGITLVAFRNRERLRRFEQLREDDQALGLSAAAEAAGFPSYTQFYRIHRELRGRSPREGR